ncbi:hypothetical protein B4064_0371 [Caldibacillus thermoamylovorans]|uniref:YqfQ-like protein n=1 Tax=Caldibacillus thermoamylovorans TaxID=35841 RepID=A0ABD4A225_9BACI|nr:VrrA/YqfQ family protein [Caldibacillus thermoamylovorans]KIO61214.1 hypothetical protein B4166_0964 [Caldibacillus thermoamylovorans]KIO62897.1 hypothetical protein B4064_0371 [Caldibacillus thermoamylovorans]KIO70308.1 hypothetical protein B4167_1000 [Caldibacillus thermoamylovorans]
MPPRFQQVPPPNPYRFFTPSPRPRGMYGGMPRNIGRPRPFQMQQARFEQPKRVGFLSRLFKGKSGIESIPPQPVNPFLFGSGVGYQEQTGIRSFLNPESISNFLGQTQQVLRTGQQIGSMVQQYGPLVKNLPALWKLYRSLQNSSDQDNDNEENTETDLEDEKVERNKDELESKENENNHDRSEEESKQSLEENEKIDSQKRIALSEQKAEKDKRSKKKQPLQFKSSVPKLYI